MFKLHGIFERVSGGGLEITRTAMKYIQDKSSLEWSHLV